MLMIASVRIDELPEHYSWQYFNRLLSEDTTKYHIDKALESVFLESDVHDLLDPDPDAETPKSENRSHPNKRVRMLRRHKELCRVTAKGLWDSDPTLTIVHMAECDEINLLFDGSVYVEKTIRNWIKDLNPNPKPGRRTNRK